MADEKDFFSFDEALDELRLKEEELKRLVSEGEIRAFRQGDTMKLRRADVESLRAELSGGDVVDLGDVVEDLVFEDDTAFDDEGMATQEISDVDTIIDEDIEDVGEIDLEEEVLEVEEEEIEEAAPVRAAVVEDDEPAEPVWVLAAAAVTMVVLLGAIPVMYSAFKGKASGLATSLAGAVASFEEAPAAAPAPDGDEDTDSE